MGIFCWSLGEVETASLLRHISSGVLRDLIHAQAIRAQRGADTSGSSLRQPTSLTRIPISTSRARAVARRHMTSRDDNSIAVHLIYRAVSVSCPWCLPESLLVVACKGVTGTMIHPPLASAMPAHLRHPLLLMLQGRTAAAL